MKEKKQLILRKGIFVSVFDWVNQLVDLGHHQTSLMSLNGQNVDLPQEENAHRDGFIYFWEKDTSYSSGD